MIILCNWYNLKGNNGRDFRRGLGWMYRNGWWDRNKIIRVDIDIRRV